MTQQRQRGGHTLPGVLDPQVLGLDITTARQMPAEEYCARVLAAICEVVTRYYQPGLTRMVNYRQLPGVVWSLLAGHFRVDYTREDVETMRLVAQFDAKHAGMPFEKDSDAKQHLVTEEIRVMVERFLRPWYDRLEALSSPIGVSHAEKL